MGLIWLFLAMGGTGCWYILLQKANVTGSPIPIQIVHVAGSSISLAVAVGIYGWRLAGGRWAFGQYWHYALFAGILITCANLAMFRAYQTLPPWLVPVILNLSCLVPVLYARFFMGQRLQAHQWLGVILAILAAAMLTAPTRDPASTVLDDPPAIVQPPSGD